ncbi:hypothetical protein H181DRAFT_01846 [Streptomyces sp. WMMB 714]|nr:hypothetical protein H181DRAFT_01846 [Streptomyces sp. WMMB 714]
MAAIPRRASSQASREGADAVRPDAEGEDVGEGEDEDEDVGEGEDVGEDVGEGEGTDAGAGGGDGGRSVRPQGPHGTVRTAGRALRAGRLRSGAAGRAR